MCPDLNFDSMFFSGDDCCVERLIKIRLGHSDEVSESMGKMRPFLMNNSQGSIAILDRISD
jgi:hypothetical protein